MKRVIDLERRAAIAERLRFYRDLGVYDLYRRAVPSDVRDAGLAGDAAAATVEGDMSLPDTPLRKNRRVSLSVPLDDEQTSMRTIRDPGLLNVPLDEQTSMRKIRHPKSEVDKPAALAAIREDLGDCKRCKLHQLGRKQIVFGVGNPEAELMFVGEGPGADEDQQGEPFVGRAGQLLNNMISAMGLRREDVYIGNVVKCRPPQNRTPERDECETCSPFLMRQIATVRPKIIVALGAVAARTLLGMNDSMAKLRGRIYDFSPGRCGVLDQACRDLSPRLPAARPAAEEGSLARPSDGDALSWTCHPQQERRAGLRPDEPAILRCCAACSARYPLYVQGRRCAGCRRRTRDRALSRKTAARHCLAPARRTAQRERQTQIGNRRA